MENNNNKTGQAKPASLLDSVVDGPISDSEISQTVTVEESISTDKLNELKSQSEQCYLQSRTEKYRALGYAYIWYHAAQRNPGYLEQAFQGFTSRSSNSGYLNAVKHCFNATGDKQASSLTKYAKVLQVVENKLGIDALDFSNVDEFVNTVVELITSSGGLDKTSEAVELYTPRKTTPANEQGSRQSGEPDDHDEEFDVGGENLDEEEPAEGQPQPELSGNVVSIKAAKASRPKVSGEYVDNQMREYLDAKPVASFKADEAVKSISGLVIAVGVQDGDTINVVDLLAAPDVLTAVIKATASARGDVDSAQGQS